MADKPYANVPKSDLTFPDKGGATGSYPVNTPKHARAALGFVGMHGTPAEKAAVRAKVHSKYPNIGQRSKVDVIKKRAASHGA